MIIKAIWLHNIRSYKDEIIAFPEKGITVIYGDIGSGKTSILGAIGFALFGNVPGAPSDPLARFANPTARDLLRRGASKGFIRLWIKSGGKDIIIHREIQETGRTVQDKGGWILVAGKNVEPGLKHLSATEMRSYIMELLGLPEEKTRARSRVFASAIYVPQFGVHSVLTVSGEERSEIVNRVLNLYKYSLAKNRIDTLKSVIRRKIERELRIKERELEIEISKEHEIKKNIEKLEREMLELKRKLKELSEKIDAKNKEAEELEKRVLEKQKEISELETYSKRVEELNIAKEELLEEIGEKNTAEILKELNESREKLSEIFKEIEKLEKLRNNISSEISSLQSALNAKIKSKESVISKLQLKKGELNKLIERLREIEDLERKGKCPVCKQPVTHTHAKELKNGIKSKVTKVESEIKELSNKVKALENGIKSLENTINEKNNVLKEVNNRYSTALTDYKEANSKVTKLSVLYEKAKKLEEISSELKVLQEKLSRKEHVIKEYNRLKQKLEDIKKEHAELTEEYRSASEDYGRVRGELKGLREMLKQIDEKKEKLNEIRAEINKYTRYLNFVNKYILSIISEVERYVKNRAFSAFREEFMKIFKTLMSGYENIDVEIKPDFSLSFKAKIDGVLKTIETPSGGQLTCISLAYRLALNRVARSMIPQLSKGLLILDEPTYGFSPERVELLRKVLFSPGGPNQVIVVTHDRTFYEATGEERLSIIRLELDSTTTVTKVFYENIDENYIRKVKEAFREIRRAVIELKEKPIAKEYVKFKPIIKTKVEVKKKEVKAKKKEIPLIEFFKQEE